jgi:hypothetical protein
MVMSKRHDAIGIKQTIRIEWMQKTANMLMAGLDTKTIRLELHEYLSGRMGSGSDGERGEMSRTQVVNMLMKIWVAPDPELLSFRNTSLSILQDKPSMSLAVHWGMITAAYPFWLNVARQTGRLLSLQDKVTQMQITGRLKDQYGDRQTVSRYARYVIRSFVAWEVLKDSDTNGCYEKAAHVNIDEPKQAIVLFEAALLTNPEAKSTLGLLLNNPAFFPFRLPVMTGDLISRVSDRIDVVRYGLDEELLKIKGP